MKAIPLKVNTFSRILGIVLVLVATVLLFNRYSTIVTIRVLEREIRSASLSSLSVFAREIDSFVDRLSIAAVRASRDQDVLLFRDWTEAAREYDQFQTIRRIEERLTLQSVSLNWSNQFAVYSPALDMRIVAGSLLFEPEVTLIPDLVHTWSYAQIGVGPAETDDSEEVFVRHIVDPPWVRGERATIDKARLVVEMIFPVRELVRIMSEQRMGLRNNPHMYHPDYPPIRGAGANVRVVEELREHLAGIQAEDSGSLVVSVAGAQHLVTYVYLSSLGWYLIDAVPIEATLSPILGTWRLFRLSAFGILIVSGLIAWYVYRTVHQPIRGLVGAFAELRAGNYGTRLSTWERDEFHYLIRDFNYMAAEIQRLIDTVYQEKIRARDARLKQLQAQINPHFLYNCLTYIVGMAKLDRTDAVMEMAHNLSDYYRYTAHAEVNEVSLDEELQLTENYLRIEQMRRPTLRFEVQVSPPLRAYRVPRLVLQPIVENAVVHGLGGLERPEGRISIVGRHDPEYYVVRISDNGAGIEPEALDNLRRAIELPKPSEGSFGLWNVHNRVRFRLGSTAGITIESEIGRYTFVELHFPTSLPRPDPDTVSDPRP